MSKEAPIGQCFGCHGFFAHLAHHLPICSHISEEVRRFWRTKLRAGEQS